MTRTFTLSIAPVLLGVLTLILVGDGVAAGMAAMATGEIDIGDAP